MTKDEAVEAVVVYADGNCGSLDELAKKNILVLIEQNKKQLLSMHYWRFSRGFLSYIMPYIFYYDKKLDVVRSYNYDYDIILRSLDFFYLIQEFSLDDVLSFYDHIVIFDVVDDFVNPIKQKYNYAYSVTPVKDYFNFFLELYNDKKSINYYSKDFISIINQKTTVDYHPKNFIDKLDFSEYKTQVEKFINQDYKNKVDFIKADQAKIDLYYMSVKKEKMSFICEIKDVQCTLNKDIEELPDDFVGLICEFAAYEYLRSKSGFEGANYIYRSALRKLDIRRSMHQMETNTDLEETVKYNKSSNRIW